MTCEQMTELLQCQLDNELTAEQLAQLSAHLQQCHSCANLQDELQSLSIELDKLPKVVPPWSIVDSILPRLDEIDAGVISLKSSAPSVPSVPFKRNAWKSIAGIAIAAIVMGIIFTQIMPVFKVNHRANEVKFTAADKSLPQTTADATVQRNKMAANNSLPVNSTSNGAMPAESNSNDSIAAKSASPADSLQADSQSSGSIQQPEISAAPVSPRTFMVAKKQVNNLFSSDAQWEAYVDLSTDEQTVHIRDKEGKDVFVSENHWDSTAVIKLISWEADNLLTYQVTLQNSQVNQFVIDIAHKTEKAIH